MNRNLAGSIYGRSSLKIAYFIPIRYQTWPPQTILVSDWLISKRTFQGCFLPSFGSFGKAASEEKIFLEINQSETRIVCGGHVC
jgi:hypothetical protein